MHAVAAAVVAVVAELAAEVGNLPVARAVHLR